MDAVVTWMMDDTAFTVPVDMFTKYETSTVFLEKPRMNDRLCRLAEVVDEKNFTAEKRMLKVRKKLVRSAGPDGYGR